MKNKNVLVTGAGGFIGSHLTEELVRRGNSVRAFVKYNSSNSWGWLEKFPPEIKSALEVFSGDVRDYNCVRQSMKGRELVFHLAALIGIPYSYSSPESYVDVNITGTLNVLQAARDFGVERVLVTSTSEVFGTAKCVPISEEHPRQGQSPYSATKIAADAVAQSFFLSFNLPVVIARPFNTYGPRQSARAVIPTIISQLLSKKDEIKLGSLRPTRDLVFVQDTVEGFIRLAYCDKAIGNDVNIATQSEISIGGLAGKIVELINPSARIICDDARVRPTASEVERLLGSNERLFSLTGWKPSVTLEEGLQKTIGWISENLKWYKPDIYNI